MGFIIVFVILGIIGALLIFMTEDDLNKRQDLFEQREREYDKKIEALHNYIRDHEARIQKLEKDNERNEQN